MERVFIGVGSNIDPEENIGKALHLLNDRIRIKAVSTFYCTEPEGRPDQPPFYNGVVEVAADLSPSDLKRTVLRTIEEELGRRRTDDRYAPRAIDLDVIVYGDRTLSTDYIVVPDPQIPERAFLAVPLYELAPDLVLSDSGEAIRKIADGFKDHSMKPLIEYTQLLRKDVLDGPRES